MSANNRQVAGKHYEGLKQHWDFVAKNNLDYFQAQISRYISRCKKKNGREDLEKACHYLEKYSEVVMHDPMFSCSSGTTGMSVGEFANAQRLDEDQRHFLHRLVDWQDIGLDELTTLRTDLNEYMNHLYPQPEGDAGPGYVNQDR